MGLDQALLAPLRLLQAEPTGQNPSIFCKISLRLVGRALSWQRHAREVVNAGWHLVLSGWRPLIRSLSP